jgi:phage terminase large subunit-like protein
MWDASCRGEHKSTAATYALDGSMHSDCTALVGCVRIDGVIHCVDVHIWEPDGSGKEVDQNKVMNTIRDLHRRKLLRQPLYYDPYQLVKLAQDLRAEGIRCQEFSQGAERIKADTSLYKLYQEGGIVNYAHPGLRSHILSAAVRSYGDEEIRIIKPEIKEEGVGRVVGKLDRKVDAAVAQSMAAYKAYTKSDGGWAMSGIR